MLIAVHNAKANLSRLIDAALAGEEVLIARGDTPVMKLTPLRSGRFKIGMLEGKLGTGPNFFEPMSESELAAWECRG
jgi:antitoxin (DNA-binding transcriptional repressor) of toxin-antitoxin stability system